MSTTTTPPPSHRDDVDADDPQPRRRIRIGTLFGAAVCLIFLGMWVYVFTHQNSYKPAGQLADTTFPKAAEPICKTARDAIDQLPPSREAKTATERADTIDEATDHLVVMQRELEAVVPDTADAKWIGQWVDDWSIFIQDRFDYADRLRKDDHAEFLVTEKYGTQLSKSMDNYAQVNFMPSCKVPGDV